MERPACFDFAMDFFGDPEATEVLAYVEALERLLSMPRLISACDALGVPADGENAALLRAALRGA